MTLDDKLLAKEYAYEILGLLRDIGNAVARIDASPRGRKKEAAHTGLYLSAKRAREDLRKMGM